MKAILNEDYKSVQPGLAADENFLRLRFLLSLSYASCILLHLVKDGAIILYGGFQYDWKRILHLLSLIKGSPPPQTPTTPPRFSSSSATHSGSRSILKHTLQSLSSPSKVDHSTTPSSLPNTSITNASSNSFQAKKHRWDHNSSPLKNPFVESEDEHLEGYESAASFSSG